MNASDYINDQIGEPPVSASDYIDQQIDNPIVGNANDYSKTKGFVQGLRAPLDAGAQMLAHALPDSVVQRANDLMGNFAPKTSELDKKISQKSNQYSADRQAAGKTGIDWPYMAGNVVGSAPIAAAMPEMGGLSLVAKTANVLGQGAVLGSLSPVTENQSDFWGQKGGQAALGAATNGVVAPISSMASSIISPKISSSVQTLLDEGVTPTPGQILGGGWKASEDKLTSVPILGDMIKNAQSRAANDLNVAVGNRALAPIGETVSSDAGRDMVDEVGSKLGSAYDQLLPKLTFKPDAQFSSELNKISQMATFMPKPQADQFQNILNNKLYSRMSQNGQMDGQTLKGVESELRQQAQGYLKDPSFDNRQLGSAVQETLNSVRGNLQRTNPQYASQLADINRGYANYSILRKAASNLGQSSEPGVFSPSQLQSAVKSADQSVGKGSFAKGNARMQDLSDAGLKVLGGKYPDSGTPGREMAALLAGGMMEGGGALLHHPLLPLSIGAGVLPYTELGQKATASLLTKRPNIAQYLANAIQKSSPYASAGVTGLANQFAPFSLNGGL